jgi:SAM-dependent methyltransferase
MTHPGEERRHPRTDDRHYLALAPLAEGLRRAVRERLAGRRDLDVLDVGCGAKPYLPFFEPVARSYRGLDSEPGPYVDDVGGAERLPYADASFDVVLCTQVLEHLYEPDRAVREIHRVLRPGGLALVSTHGVFLYHPDPPDSDRDFWRWTHSGLARLFRTSADWRSIDVEPQGDVVACLAYIACQFVAEAGDRAGRPALRRAAVGTLNRGAAWLDRRYPPRARVPRPGSLSANYLVAAVKAG